MALNNLAFLMAETGGDLDDALTKAQRAKQLLPSLYEISDTLGWIYLKKNLADKAIDIFKDLVAKAAEPLDLSFPSWEWRTHRRATRRRRWSSFAKR